MSATKAPSEGVRHSVADGTRWQEMAHECRKIAERNVTRWGLRAHYSPNTLAFTVVLHLVLPQKVKDSKTPLFDQLVDAKDLKSHSNY